MADTNGALLFLGWGWGKRVHFESFPKSSHIFLAYVCLSVHMGSQIHAMHVYDLIIYGLCDIAVSVTKYHSIDGMSYSNMTDYITIQTTFKIKQSRHAIILINSA